MVLNARLCVMFFSVQFSRFTSAPEVTASQLQIKVGPLSEYKM